MRLFNVELNYSARRRTRRPGRMRTEYGKIRMVVMALGQADAIARAEAWFHHQLTDPGLARITFGTGIRDCDPGSVTLSSATQASLCDMPHIAVVN